MFTSQLRDLMPHFIPTSFCMLLKNHSFCYMFKITVRSTRFLDYISFNSKDMGYCLFGGSVVSLVVLQMRGKDGCGRRGLRERVQVGGRRRESGAFSIKTWRYVVTSRGHHWASSPASSPSSVSVSWEWGVGRASVEESGAGRCAMWKTEPMRR